MTTRIAQYATLIIPFAAWVMAIQFCQILPYTDCHDQSHWTLLSGVAAVSLSMIAILVGAWQARKENKQTAAGMLCILCSLTGLLFVFALGLQLAASTLVYACEH